jgi:phosphatidate cytidylyltransferase
MLKVRVLTAAVLGGLILAALFLLPARATVLVFGLICSLGAWEWTQLGGLRGRVARGAYTAAIALLMLGAWRLSTDERLLAALLGAAAAWWLIALAWIVLAPSRQSARLTLACGVIVLVPAFVALAHLEVSSQAGVAGAERVLWLLLLVVAADIGAFFAGRAFGQHRLAPRVSPGKTWEGAVGGLVTVALVAGVGALRLALPVGLCVGFGCLLGVFSIVGDLTESMFKRAAGLKDSGGILPGHGGVLDRIDSITAAAPLYALGWLGLRAFA